MLIEDKIDAIAMPNQHERYIDKAMFRLWPDRHVRVKRIRIGRMPAIIVMPKHYSKGAPGVVWIHGGGYILGMKEIVYMSRAMDLVRDLGAVVISPGYRLAWQKPYPAAVNDCYEALRYLNAQQRRYRVIT